MFGSELRENQDYIINEHNKYLNSNNHNTNTNIFKNFTDWSYQDFSSDEDNGCNETISEETRKKMNTNEEKVNNYSNNVDLCAS